MSVPWPGSKEDLIIGTLDPSFPLFPQQVKLTPGDQAQHATIWGRTGSGKSKLLQSLFLQHLRLGHGVGVIEPHNDLSLDIITSLVTSGFYREQDAYERLVYLDWGNGWYVPFNVLAGTGDPYTVALQVLEAMLRVWPALLEAPMFQTLFLSGMIVLIADRLPITFLYQLLIDEPFRSSCLRQVDDRLVHQTFDTYRKLGRNQVHAAGSVLRRAFLLSFSPLCRNTLGQPDNWLNLRQLMDQGKSVIINLGNIPDQDTRNLLGALLLVQFEQAALSRADLAPARRRPFTLLVDEWPAFAAREQTIGTILSQTRKFNLFLYLAAQSVAQVTTRRLAGALENCGANIAFGLGRDSAELHARHIGQADPFAIKEEPPTEAHHSQYMTIAEQFEVWTGELQRLPPQVAYVKSGDRPAIRMRALPVPPARADAGALQEVLTHYRKRYQRSPEDTSGAIAQLHHPPSQSHQPFPVAPGSRESGADHRPAYQRLFPCGPGSSSVGESI